MKTKITLLILLITAAVTTIDARTWGMGIVQREEVGINFDNKQDYYNFAKLGIGFPMQPNTLYIDKSTGKPMKLSYYKTMVPLLQKKHNESLCAQLTYINAMTGGQLCRDFGFAFSDFAGHLDEALQVFMSDKVTYGPAPDELVIYDGVDIDKKSIDTVLRDAYVNKILGLVENGWWLNVTYFMPIYQTSAWCNNLTSTIWLATHIVKLEQVPMAIVPAPQKAEVKKRYYYEEVVIEEKISKKTNTSVASTKGSNSTVSARTATAVATTSGLGQRNTSRNGDASANAVSGIGASEAGTTTASSSDDDEEYGAAGNVQK